MARCNGLLILRDDTFHSKITIKPNKPKAKINTNLSLKHYLNFGKQEWNYWDYSLIGRVLRIDAVKRPRIAAHTTDAAESCVYRVRIWKSDYK